MARESKRKREARRFGRPERLIDLVAETPPESWRHPLSLRHSDEVHKLGYADTMVGIITRGPVSKLVEATNVADYSYRHAAEARRFSYDGLRVSPSFDEMFIEAFAPPTLGRTGNVMPWPRFLPKQFGFYVQRGPAETWIDHWAELIGRNNYRTEGARSGIVLIPVWNFDGKPMFPGCSMNILLDGLGNPIDRPISSIDHWHHVGGTADNYRLGLELTAFAALQAIMFMNCKNVVLSVVEPDARLNRERRKAGLRAFLRYHTINIEPMKTVLRSEGDIESVGLGRALHIVRGHFSHYTEEKPLFGRPGLAGDFWMPTHVRGSARQGVVVSDYNIVPPDAN